MKNEIPIWAVFPMIMGAIMLMLAAVILIFLCGPLAFDILGEGAPSWQVVLVMFGSVFTGGACGQGSVLILRQLFS